MEAKLIIPDHVYDMIESKAVSLPQSYQNAILALSECNEVDECKEWKDKAAAIASYAKQTGDETMMKLAKRIQVRAYRRMGELLKQFDAKGKRTDIEPSTLYDTRLSQKEVATNAGLSKRQKDTAVRISNIPDKEFNRQVDSDKPPTITFLAEQGKKKSDSGLYDPKPEGFAQAIYMNARFRDMAKSMQEFDPFYILGGMDENQVKSMRESIKVIEGWIDNFVVNT